MGIDARSINNNAVTKSNDSHVQQLREQIGTGFTDQLKQGNQGKKRNEMGKDDFMKLMTAQLKYQDPINPVKNEEMAAQLAQFSSLEQMMNVNQNLEKMVAGQRPQENMIAASLIGKRVMSDFSKINYDKKSEPTVKFDLPANTSETLVAVADEKGEVVREIKLGAMKQGPQAIKWDGKSTKGLEQPAGNYTFHVMAKDMAGKPVEVKTGNSGIVSGVVFDQGRTLLMVDGKKIPVESVGQIEQDVAAPKAPVAAAEANPLTAPNTGKQNQVSGQKNVVNNENISQQGLPTNLDAETIKSMMAAAAKQSEPAKVDGSAAIAEQDAPMPLWNPNL